MCVWVFVTYFERIIIRNQIDVMDRLLSNFKHVKISLTYWREVGTGLTMAERTDGQRNFKLKH